MEDFIIITDGSGDLTAEQRQKFNIEKPLPGTVLWPDNVSRTADPDWNNITPEKYFEMMDDKKNVFKTSLPAPSEIYEILEKYAKEGKNIIIPTLSGGMSGTFSVVSTTANELMENYPGVKIHVVDSRRYGGATALLAVTASIHREKGFSFQETCDYIDNMALNVHECGFLDDLFFLHRSGRVSKMAAVMGTMVGIKPMADFDNETGKSIVIGKARGNKKFLKALPEYVKQTIGSAHGKVFIVTHSNREKVAKEVERIIKETFNPENILFVSLGQLNGANVGPGLCAVFYAGDEPTSPNCDREKEILEKILA